jgi:hypothetical protein
MHNLSDLNAYAGLLVAMCFVAIAACWIALYYIVSILARFYDDYRKVNRLDEREKYEDLL